MCESLPKIDPRGVTWCVAVTTLVYGFISTIFFMLFFVVFLGKLGESQNDILFV